MSNLNKLLNSNKILKTWCTIYAMFLVINIGISLFNKEYLHSTCFADLFINYQGGFVRRGLLREFLLYCYHKNVNPYTVAISLSFISYGVVTIYMLYLHFKEQFRGLFVFVSEVRFVHDVCYAEIFIVVTEKEILDI